MRHILSLWLEIVLLLLFAYPAVTPADIPLAGDGAKARAGLDQATLPFALAADNRSVNVFKGRLSLDTGPPTITGGTSGSEFLEATEQTSLDDITLGSNLDRRTPDDNIISLTGRKGMTGELDTDPSGWDDVLGLLEPQNQNAVTFKLDGRNSSAPVSVRIRNRFGPEPVTAGLIGLSALGLLVVRKLLKTR